MTNNIAEALEAIKTWEFWGLFVGGLIVGYVLVTVQNLWRESRYMKAKAREASLEAALRQLHQVVIYERELGILRRELLARGFTEEGLSGQ
jgi:hypothetical protein